MADTKTRLRFPACVALLVSAAFMPASGALALMPAPTWAEVGTVLADRCTVCHSGEGAPSGLRLDTLAAVLAGGANGPVLVAGNPDASELVRRIRGETQPRMPLAGDPLRDEQIAMIEGWVVAGMPEGTAARPAAPGVATPALPLPGEPVAFGHVEAIFLQRCVSCHSEPGVMGAPPERLRLDSYVAIIAGGDRLVVFPGRPEFSEVLRRIAGIAGPAMPFGGPPLGAEEIELILRWIAGGALDAEGAAPPLPVGAEVRMNGTMTGAAELDGAAFVIDDGTRIEDRPGVGQPAEFRGIVAADGTVRATRLDGG